MDDETPAPAPKRRFAPQKQEIESLIANIRSSAGFIVAMGFLIGSAGIITFMGFHNKISMLMLDLGFVLFLFGVAVKLLDICAQIISDKRG